MPAASNKRVFYAMQQVGLQRDGTAGFNALHGVQRVGMTTNFNLDQVFELGQLAIYENIEDTPDVQVSLTKVLDGYPLIYHRATEDDGTVTTAPTIGGRSAAKCIFGLAIFSDTSDSATGTPGSIVECSGMYVQSVAYNFPVDGNFSEEVTLVGNNKLWRNDPRIVNATDAARAAALTFTGAFANDDAPIGQGGVNRRQDLDFGATTGVGFDINGMSADPDCTILPPDIYGISSSGTNEKSNGVDFDAHVQNISVSVDFGREEINELGRRLPYHRFITFPTEVTCSIEVLATSGDMISATEEGILTTNPDADCADVGNLSNRTIRIATCEGTRIYLGYKNKLSSVDYGGGEAGGGNVSLTFNYSTFNDFTVLHTGDPHDSGTVWWTNRSTYLVNT